MWVTIVGQNDPQCFIIKALGVILNQGQQQGYQDCSIRHVIRPLTFSYTAIYSNGPNLVLSMTLTCDLDLEPGVTQRLRDMLCNGGTNVYQGS